VIETALLGRAECLCTLDRHFHASQVARFLAGRSIEVLDDVQLLKRLRSGATK
jgi:hypothetical protein